MEAKLKGQTSKWKSQSQANSHKLTALNLHQFGRYENSCILINYVYWYINQVKCRTITP